MWKWGHVGGDYLMRSVNQVVENHFWWSIKEPGRHLGRPKGKRVILELLAHLFLFRNLLTISTDPICGHESPSPWFRVSQPGHYWHLGLNDALFRGLSHTLKDFSCILGFYLLDAPNTPLPRCESANVSRHCHHPLGGKITASSEPLLSVVQYLSIFL